MGPYPPEVELAQHANPANQGSAGGGWYFHNVRGVINPDDIRVRPRAIGVVDVWMDSDPGM